MAALDESEWFVLLASSESARSPWVNREIEHWLETKSAERILSVVTEGTWVWDGGAGGLVGSAVPEALRVGLGGEPRHLDLRWAAGEADLDLRHSGFRSAVADLAAPMHGLAKDEIVGEDIRQHRRVRRLARSAVIALVVLAMAATVFAVTAVTQRGRALSERDRADQQARLADARRLATTAVSGARDDLARSALLAIEANGLEDDAATRGALLSLVEDAAPVREIIHGSWETAAVAPDGATVATVGRRGVALIDLATRRSRALRIHDLGGVRSAAFSQDGRQLALAGEAVVIVDARTGAQIRPPLRVSAHVGSERTLITSVRFSPDGSSIAALASDGIATVWSTTTGAELGRFLTNTFGPELNDIAFSPDGNSLAATGNGGVVLDAHSLTPRYRSRLSEDDGSFEVAFSPDGRRLATAGRNGIVSVDSATGSQLGAPITTGSSTVVHLAFSPDGHVLAGALTDGSITEWDANSGAVLRRGLLGATRAPLAMSFTAAGRTLVVLTTTEITVLDPVARLAHEIAAPNAAAVITSVALAPDGRSVAATDTLGRVRVWDLASGRLERTIAVTSALGAGAAVIAFRPGTNTIVVGAGDGTVAPWDARSGRRLHAPIRLTTSNIVVGGSVPGLGVVGVAFDAGGDALVAAGADGKVSVIDPVSWSVRRRVPLIDDALFWATLAVSPDGRTVALGGPRAVVIADIDGSHRRRVDIGQLVTTSIGLQPGGRLLAVGLEDGRVLLADLDTGRVRRTIVSNHGGVFALTFDRTGSTLAVGGRDGTVSLWDVGAGQPLGPPLSSLQTKTVDALAFTAGDDSLVAGSEDGSVVRYALGSPRWVSQLCAVIGRNLTPDERHAYLADPNAGRRTCPNWPAER